MDTIGGFRIVRKLGSGSRAEVYLGYTESNSRLSQQTVAIKHYRPDVGAASIDTELSALASVDSPHIVKLVDLSSNAGVSPSLILQRLNPGGLPKLLLEHHTISPGEFVTVTAPIAIAIAQLHRAGYIHGRLRAANVLFDQSGAPVLAGFGAARAFALQSVEKTAALIDSEVAVSNDLERLVRIVRGILDRVEGAESARKAIVLGDWLESAPAVESNSTLAATLVERLFEFADAAPIRHLGAPEDLSHCSSVPGRLEPSRQIAADSLAANATRLSDTRKAARIPAPRWLDPLLVKAADRGRQLGVGVAWERLRTASSNSRAISIRKRAWIVASATGIALFVALLVVTSPPARSDSKAPPESTTESSLVKPTGTQESDMTSEKAAIISDDPVVALTALLRRRTSCITDRTVLCLDDVDQSNSAAWEADEHGIRLLQQGAESTEVKTYAGYSLTLQDRMGDTALIQLSTGAADTMSRKDPASILLIKTEAGWRIRDIVLDPAS